MAEVMTLCDFADQSAASNCGESLAGISTTVYIGFKNDMKTPLPILKEPTAEDTEFGIADYAEIESTPGFQLLTGKRFYKWEFETETGQLTTSSNGQKKGFTQTFTFKIANMTPELSALLRNLNNRLDVFFLFPEQDHFVAIYDPDRNVKIDSGGIAYDSGNTVDSEFGTTVTVSLSTRLPKTYYFGTVSTEPTV